MLVGLPPSRGTTEIVRDLDAAERVQVVPRVPLYEYYRWYNEIDIALDTAPYSGGTTTCDSLYMGVPVVTAPGTRAISRSAGSLLSAVGLQDWIATDYVDLAVKKASDMEALAALRAGLRRRVQNSPVMNEEKAARDLEAAYRHVWRNWCEGRDASMA